MAGEPASLVPSKKTDIHVAYAKMEAELAQKKEVIIGLHLSIERAKTYPPPPTGFLSRQQHGKHVDALELKINVLKETIRQLETQRAVVSREKYDTAIDRLRERIDLLVETNGKLLGPIIKLEKS